jgi:hypothetical protein
MTVTLSRTTDERLDQLSAQVAFLVADAERRNAERERWSELTHDLAPIGRQAMGTATETFEDLDLSLEDLARFARTMVDALPTLEAGMAQLGSLSELAGTVSELSGPAFEAVTSRFAAADDKGYFAFARAGAGIAERVVTSFTEEDVEALGENIVLILNTVKEMTQPEVMGMLRRTIHTVQDQDTSGEPPSMFALVREMRDPQVRRGLARMLAALRSMGEER